MELVRVNRDDGTQNKPKTYEAKVIKRFTKADGRTWLKIIPTEILDAHIRSVLEKNTREINDAQ